MTEKELVNVLVESVGQLPARVEVLEVRQHSLEDLHQRTKQFLARTADALKLRLERSDWIVQHDRTVVRLAAGARAVVHHGSGAMSYRSGIGPMDGIFREVEPRERLTKRVEDAASHLKLRDWVAETDSIAFERLWQIKAAASDRAGKAVSPVLCRALGAYRHSVGKLPVWGPASVTVTLAGEGVLDAVAVCLREHTGKAVDSPEVLRPDSAARQILGQLATLMGKSNVPYTELAAPQWMRLGYLNLGRRKAQRLLAPVYIAAIRVVHKEEAQAYLFATAATERTYLPLPVLGAHPPLAPFRRGEHPNRLPEPMLGFGQPGML